MDIIIFALLEASAVVLPVLWLRSVERKEDEEERKRQQSRKTAGWIQIDFTPIVNGNFVR